MGSGAIVGSGWAYRPRSLLYILMAVCVVVYTTNYFWYALQDNNTQPIVRNTIQQKHTILHEKLTTQSTTHHLEVKEMDMQNMTTINYNITVSNLNVTHNMKTTRLMTNLTDSNGNFVTAEGNMNTIDPVLSLCGTVLPGLGPVSVDETELELDFVEKKYPEINTGGWYTPTNCIPRDKVAIIIPYRDREEHLAIFLNHMHPFLMKQQIQYGIFIVEQKGDKDFNRGKLMNIGSVESQKLVPGGWQCFIFHDIDLLPLDSRNLYSCPDQPRHMSAAIDKFNFKLPYKTLFGGVSAIRTEQFTKANGFSNMYWGWGGEDDDIYKRLMMNNYRISRPNMSIARYTMLKHNKSAPNPERFKLLAETNKIYQKDGLSTLEYEVVEIIQYHLYTYLLVNIDEHR